MQAQHSARDSSALSAARLSRPQPLLAWHLGLSTTVHRRAQGAGQGRPRHQAGRWFMASGHVGSSQTMGAEPAWLQGPGSAFPLPDGSGTRPAQRGEAGLTPPGWCGLVARAPRPDRPRVGRPGLRCTGGRKGTQRWSRAEPRAVSALPPGHVVETLSLDLCPQRDLRTEGRTAALGLRGWPRQLQGRGERALDSLGRLAGPGWCRHRAASRSTWPGEAHPPSLLQTGPQTLPVPPEPRWWGSDFLPAQLLNQVCS